MDGSSINALPVNTSRVTGPASWLRRQRGFAVMVGLPTVAALLYFGLIASDLYLSEARFVVRSPDRQVATGLGALMKSAGFSRSQDDAFTVTDYLRSRDAMAELDRRFGLARVYGSGAIDRFSRFNGLGLDASREALFRYYQERLHIDLDPSSSIATITVRAFDADDAQRINQTLLELGERLINQLNARGREDMVSFARTEVAAAEDAARRAAQALALYRNTHRVFDPERQSALQLQSIARLREELLAARTQLAQVVGASPLSPQRPALEQRVALLQGEIGAQSALVAGGADSLTSHAATFERLTLERSLADKQLASAMASLELARNEAQRKQLYLERIVQPSRPDVATEPRRLRAILATFLCSLIVWSILKLLVAGAKEHRD